MVLKGQSKLYKHPKAATLYLCIPSDLVKDSQFPFEAGEVVSVEFHPSFKVLIVRKKKEGSDDGISVKESQGAQADEH